MKIGEGKIQIRRRIDRLTVGVIFYEEINSEKIRVHNFSNGESKKMKRQEGEEIPDDYILEIPERWLELLVERLDEEGVKTEKDAKIKGKLEAKEDHLEDMRKLVFSELDSKSND